MSDMIWACLDINDIPWYLQIWGDMGDTHHLLLSDIYVIPPPDISTQLASQYKIFKLNRESEELGHSKSIVLLLCVDTMAMFVLLL